MTIKALNKTLLGKVEGLQRHSKLDFTDGNKKVTVWSYHGVPITQVKGKRTCISFSNALLKDFREKGLTDIEHIPFKTFANSKAFWIGDKFFDVKEFELEELLAAADKFREAMI